MSTTSSIIESIQKRTSVRTFEAMPLDPVKRGILIEYLKQKQEGPFPGQTRFELIEWEPGKTGDKQKLGTYGTITNASSFIAGAVKRGPYALENFGYLLEKIILLATGMELGTCWLGGSLQRQDIARRISAQADEYIPAITPIGVPAKEKTIQERFILWSAKARNRKPWNELFFAHDYSKPLEKSTDNPYHTLLEMVRLAPSASNRQPWRIIFDQPNYHFYIQHNPIYSQVAKTVMHAEDIQRLDMGIAMCHFELAAQELKLKGKWIVQQPEGIKLPENTEYCFTWNGSR